MLNKELKQGVSVQYILQITIYFFQTPTILLFTYTKHQIPRIVSKQYTSFLAFKFNCFEEFSNFSRNFQILQGKKEKGKFDFTGDGLVEHGHYLQKIKHI